MDSIVDSFSTAQATEDGLGCFHCGLPVPRGGGYTVLVDGAARTMCCPGCQAVAQAIADGGFAAYYRHRAAPAARGEPAAPPHEFLRYDIPEVQRSFVRASAEHLKEAALIIEGITCGACAWLIEQRLRKLPGVAAVVLNYAMRRARVTWDERRVRLSAILRAIAEIGYRAQPYDSAHVEEAQHRERRQMLWRLFVAGFGMMQVMMYAVPAYIADGDLGADIEQLLRVASLVLTAPVVLWAAGPFYLGAWRDVSARRVGMDVPVALGIGFAFAASLLATWRGGGEVYYDSITMFVFLLLGARFLEMNARAAAARAHSRLATLVPAVAERLSGDPHSAATEQVAVASLACGDRVRVRPGAVIPADGVIVEGASAVHEALLTGESRPLRKQPGDRVIGGAVNLHGPLTVRVERVGAETVLAGIVRLLDRAQAEKPRIAAAAERAAQWFVLGLLIVAAATAAGWYLVAPDRALWIVVAVLVVTCPCALSLATPAALTAATGALYGRGILVTRGHALETLARATHFVFDKTGTLTLGRMALVGVIPLGDHDRENALALAAQLERASEHPIARALLAAAQDRVMQNAGHVTELRNHPGAGIEARVDGRLVRIGGPGFVSMLTRRPLPDELVFAADEVTVVALGDEHGWIALFTLGDPLRRNARTLVRELERRGKTVCLLSGDRPQAAQHAARQLGIDTVHGGSSPAEKLDVVRALQARGAVVAMIGDGINDAPVLAQAQVSVAMGGATELAQVNADMILLSERPEHLLEAVDTAAKTMRVIRQNLAWAAAYNAAALPLAILGYVTPLVAGTGMALSSLAVVANALRLLKGSHAAANAAAPGGRAGYARA